MSLGPYHAFNAKVDGYAMWPMPLSLCKKWLQVDNDLSDAVHIVRSHYHSIFIYPCRLSDAFCHVNCASDGCDELCSSLGQAVFFKKKKKKG